MKEITGLLRDNPLLLLFVVAAIGYPLGRLKIAGARLGVAMVLFVGLAVGALSPDVKLPEVIYQFGLALFVYTLGLSSGSVVFAALGRKTLRYSLLAGGVLVLAAALTWLLHHWFHLSPSITAGLYAGSLTSTPALAGVIEHVQAAGGQGAALSEPVVAYSLSYPFGVLGMILAIYLFQRLVKVDYAAEARGLPENTTANEPIQNRTICVTRETGQSVADLVRTHHWNVVFGRIRRDGQMGVVGGQTVLHPGDLVTLIGSIEALDEVSSGLGDANCGERLDFDLSQYDKRRIFVSGPQASGRRLRDLKIIEHYGALVTRIRRGDEELLPHGETVLMPGDQVRVVAPYEQMDALARLFGDSYRSVSEVDILTFSLGLALGILLGLVPFPLPGGLTLQLGLAGGPMLMALLLGALGRTGPLVWTIPFSANLTLRQIGLVCFLAGIGTRSGYAFFSMLAQGSGVLIFALGAAITFCTSLAVLTAGYLWLHIPLNLLIGVMAGMQTQTAILSFGIEQTENDLPEGPYALLYPVAMIIKILLAQALLILS